jgi:hypothetical protein
MPSRNHRLARIYIGFPDPRSLRDIEDLFALQLIGCDRCMRPAGPRGARRFAASRCHRRRVLMRGDAQRMRDVARRLLSVYARHPTLCSREWVATLSAVAVLLGRSRPADSARS